MVAPRTAYADTLREAMHQKISRRQLAKQLADETGSKEASEYRALGKYLAGEDEPSRERAAILAVILQAPGVALVDGDRGPQVRVVDHLESIEAALTAMAEGQQEILRLLRQPPASRRRPA